MATRQRLYRLRKSLNFRDSLRFCGDSNSYFLLLKSVWNLNSSSSSTLLNSSHIHPLSWNSSYYNVPNRDPGYMVEFPDVKKDKNPIDGWNLVEHPHSSRQPNHPNKY